MSELEWNNQEFLCFLLIYVSHVDMDFSESEKVRIKSMCSIETYEKMLLLFNDMNDYQALDNILKYKGVYFPTAERKMELLANIEKQFYSDGEYTEMEKTLLLFLDKMMH